MGDLRRCGACSGLGGLRQSCTHPSLTQIVAASVQGASGRSLSRFTTNALVRDCGVGLIFSNYRAFIQPDVIAIADLITYSASFAHSKLLIQKSLP